MKKVDKNAKSAQQKGEKIAHKGPKAAKKRPKVSKSGQKWSKQAKNCQRQPGGVEWSHRKTHFGGGVIPAESNQPGSEGTKIFWN